MRRFKLLTTSGYPGMLFKGKIYEGSEKPSGSTLSVIEMVRAYPDDWEEVFDAITPTTESEKSKFIISYISRDGLIVLNNIIEADNFQEAIDIIKGDEGVRAILSCYKS